MININRQQVLELVKQKGPLVPTDLTKDLNTNSIIVGAFLSELVYSKEISISSAKIGGSPVYFLQTQTPFLESKLYPYLNEKDKRAFDILKRDEVLRDEPQDPLMRTALRALKDFSIPFKVTYKGKQQLFWKYFLTSDEVVKEKVRIILNELYPESKPETLVGHKLEKPILDINNQNSAVDNSLNKKSSQEVSDTQNFNSEKVAEKVKSKISDSNLNKFTKDTSNLDDPIKHNYDDEFLKTVEGYLNSLNIKIKNVTLVKKNKEFDMVVLVPSPIGVLEYFCKARNKKKSAEGDVAQAFVEGQLKNLPSIYISLGDFSKKITDLISLKYKNLKLLKL